MLELLEKAKAKRISDTFVFVDSARRFIAGINLSVMDNCNGISVFTVDNDLLREVTDAAKLLDRHSPR